MRSDAGEGIEFDALNSGGWLSIETSAFGPMPNLAPSSIAFQTASGGGIGFWDGNAGGGFTVITGPIGALTFGGDGINLFSEGGGGITLDSALSISLDADGNLDLESSQTAQLRAAGDVILEPDRAVTGTFNLIARNLPIADPGIPGAIWNDAGTLKISP